MAVERGDRLCIYLDLQVANNIKSFGEEIKDHLLVDNSLRTIDDLKIIEKEETFRMGTDGVIL